MTADERFALKAAVDAKRRELVTLPPSPRCGTEQGYRDDGCRCEPCRKASREGRRLRRGNTSPPAETYANRDADVYRRLRGACCPDSPVAQRNQVRAVIRMLDQAKRRGTV